MFALLVAALLIVANSVATADWVETPSLGAVLLWAALTGLLLSKVKTHAIFLHLAGLAIGFVVVVWQTTSLIKDQPLVDQVPELWRRLQDWYNAAESGGISTDLLPFTLILVSASWILGYISSWFIFRRNNPWVAVVLCGVAILTNLSFLPNEFASRFFVFVFVAMLLIVRMNIVQKQEEWQAADVGYSQSTGWLTLHAAVWFGVAVVLLAALLPMRVVVSKTVVGIWRAGRTPIASLEEEFGRLFGAIPSRKNVSGRFFGETLPFLGKISFGGEPVLLADTNYPSYWLSQTYSEYTPQGWIAGPTTGIDVGPDTIQPPRSNSVKRIAVDQTLQLGFDTRELLSGGSLDWVSRKAVVETLAPKQFYIDLTDPSQEVAYPEDVRSVATTLREGLPPLGELQIGAHISQILPADLALVEFGLDGDSQPRVETVTLTRKDPVSPDIVAWSLDRSLAEGETYSMISFVSLAADDDLRGADSDYSSFITDHYLQLPPTVPERVTQLAQELTAGNLTPLDKALAVQRHLRGPTYTYSQDIAAPPSGSDGVDHFLFETQTGYSDYFASSMVVLLRSAGVPTRMAAGYGPGEYNSDLERRIIKDSDSHGWAQVYFPDYGWIDFEPTPEWPEHERALLSGPGAELVPDRGDDVDSIQDPSALEQPFLEEPFRIAGDLAPGSQGTDTTTIVIRVGVALGVLAGIWLLVQFLWTRGLVHATPAERAYTKMSRLGTIAGIGRRDHETPRDYALAVGAALPPIAGGADRIARGFAAVRYGGPEAAAHDEAEVNDAWADIRGALLGRALARFARLGFGGQR